MTNANLPTYEIFIDLEDEDTGLDANSGVHDPAHELLTITFSKDNKQKIELSRTEVFKQIDSSFNKTMQFNDENQTVYGVAISANTKILRTEENGEEYNVQFTPKGIADIIHDYSRKERFNHFNIEHNSEKLEDGVYMIMSYQIENDKGFTAPDKFKDENDGTWITGYKIVNTEVYNKFKSGEVRGFSVEGTFIMDQFEFKNDKMILSELDAILELIQK